MATASPRVNRKRTQQNARRERKRPRVPLTARLRVHLERLRLRLATWRRPLWIAGQCLVFACVVAGAAGAYRLIARYVRTAPAFATRVVEVEGLARLGKQDVLEAAGLAIGQNVFEKSGDEAAARLQQHPWVSFARVTRRLPDTYRIELRERQAVALIALEVLHLVSDDGTVFKALGAGDPADLPVITGVDPERFESDQAYHAAVALNAVALLHDYRAAGLWKREPIAEIHVEPDQGLALYVGDDVTGVRLGQAPYRDKLQRLRAVFDRLGQRKVRASYVYLDNVRRPDRVTVKLQ